MGCCFSCLKCFGSSKDSTQQDDCTVNYDGTRGSVRSSSNYTSNYGRPVPSSKSVPSSSSCPPIRNTPPHILSPPSAAPIVRRIVPTHNNANVPGLGKRVQLSRTVLPTTSSTAFPSAHAQTSTGISQQLNRQPFNNWPTRPQNKLPSFDNVTTVQAAAVPAQRATSFKNTSRTTVPFKTTYNNNSTNTNTSVKRVPQTKPVNSHSFRSKAARHDSFSKRRPSLPRANSRRSVVSIPQSPAKKQDNFDAIPLLCRILTSTPANMKRRLNVAQFFSKDNWEYPVILEYINNSQAHQDFGIEVLKIIKICQRHVTEFRNRPQYDPTSHRMMLWHGSHFDNVRSILAQGLILPETTRWSLFGNGIYFADRVSKSAQYCNFAHSGEGCLFLCDVMLGNPYPSSNTMEEITSPPFGYNSVKGIGKFVPGPVGRFEYRKFYGSKMLQGKTVPNPDTTLPFDYTLMYNEFVVYDPDDVNIKYLIYFNFTDKPFVNEL